MNDERWLKDLARRAVEREAGTGVPARWQALAAGTLPAAEQERLRSLAGESEEIRDGLELFRPLGSEFHARMAAEMRARVRPRAAGEPPGEGETAHVIAFPRLPRRARWLRAPVAAAAVAVAALGLSWLLSSQDGTPLPAYEIVLQGMLSVRSGEATPEAAVLDPDRPFQIDLKPEEDVDGAVTVSFFVTRDGQWRVWPVPGDAVRTAPSGAFQVLCPMTGDLVLEPGSWTLVAVVGRPSELPSPEEARSCFEAGEGCPDDGGWQTLSESFRVADGG